MGLDVMFFGGFLDGDNLLDPVAADYVGGRPAKIAAAGLAPALLPVDVVGLFKNDRAEDRASAPQVDDTAQTSQQRATIYTGAGKVKLFKTGGSVLGGGVPVGTVAPYQAAPTTGGVWSVGDLLFVNATGFWNNAAQAGGDPAFGRVTAVSGTAADPDSLEVILFGIPNEL